MFEFISRLFQRKSVAFKREGAFSLMKLLSIMKTKPQLIFDYDSAAGYYISFINKEGNRVYISYAGDDDLHRIVRVIDHELNPGMLVESNHTLQ